MNELASLAQGITLNAIIINVISDVIVAALVGIPAYFGLWPWAKDLFARTSLKRSLKRLATLERDKSTFQGYINNVMHLNIAVSVSIGKILIFGTFLILLVILSLVIAYVIITLKSDNLHYEYRIPARILLAINSFATALSYYYFIKEISRFAKCAGPRTEIKRLEKRIRALKAKKGVAPYGNQTIEPPK